MSTALGYAYDTQYNARRFTNRKRTITGITIHYWGSYGSAYLGIIGWFCNSNTTAQTSAHYVIEGVDVHGNLNKRVACIVDPDLIAWHAGDWNANVNTIGIECRPEASDAGYEVVSELVARLWITYGVVPLYPHNHWVSTSCPGHWDVARIQREATVKYRELKGTPITPPPPPKPVRAPDKPRNGLTVRASNLDQNDTKTSNDPTNNDIRQLAEYVWKAHGASYQKANGAAWARESRDYFGPQLSKAIRALYASLHAQYPKDDRWFTIPSDTSSSPAWGGPSFLAWLGFNVI